MTVRREMLAGAMALIVVQALGATAVQADDTILILRGSSPKAGRDGTVRSRLRDLDALPQTSFSTSTPWHKSVVKFSGVALKDYLAAFDVKPRAIRLIGLNDYAVEADTSLLLAGEALLATRQNDHPMPVSDKGPVFLVFPFDSRKDLQHQTYFSRAVWQMAEIELLP